MRTKDGTNDDTETVNVAHNHAAAAEDLQDRADTLLARGMSRASRGRAAAVDSKTANEYQGSIVDDSRFAADDRRSAAAERRAAEEDHHAAEDDRHAAQHDRRAATDDRYAAEEDGRAAANDRLAAADDSRAAAVDRHAAIADRCAAAKDRSAAADDRLAAANTRQAAVDDRQSAEYLLAYARRRATATLAAVSAEPASGAGDSVTGRVSGKSAAAAVGLVDGVVESSNEGGAVNAFKSAGASTGVADGDAAVGTVAGGTSGGGGAGGSLHDSPQTTRGKEAAALPSGTPATLVTRVHKGRNKHDRAKSHHHRKSAFFPKAPRMTVARMYADPPTPPPRSRSRWSRTLAAGASASPLFFAGDDVHGAWVDGAWLANPVAQVEAGAEAVMASNAAAMEVVRAEAKVGHPVAQVKVEAEAEVGDPVAQVNVEAEAEVGDPVAVTAPRGPGQKKRKAPTASDDDAGAAGMGP